MSEERITKITRTERYTINGKEYNSLDEIPESERRKLEAHLKMLEDKDGDGVPDILQGKNNGTAHVQRHQVHVSAPKGREEAAERVGELVNGLLKDLVSGSGRVGAQGGEQQRRGLESPQLRQQRKERQRERVRHYVAILVLLGLIAYLFLDQI